MMVDRYIITLLRKNLAKSVTVDVGLSEYKGKVLDVVEDYGFFWLVLKVDRKHIRRIRLDKIDTVLTKEKFK